MSRGPIWTARDAEGTTIVVDVHRSEPLAPVYIELEDEFAYAAALLSTETARLFAQAILDAANAAEEVSRDT